MSVHVVCCMCERCGVCIHAIWCVCVCGRGYRLHYISKAGREAGGPHGEDLSSGPLSGEKRAKEEARREGHAKPPWTRTGCRPWYDGRPQDL